MTFTSLLQMKKRIGGLKSGHKKEKRFSACLVSGASTPESGSSN
jgi:hypothetical protein